MTPPTFDTPDSSPSYPVVTARAADWAEPAAAADPTFDANGESQPVFSSTSTDWTNEDLWIESTVDSDGDGKLDLVHADVSRVPETNRTPNPLKVPVILEVSPYY